MGGYDHVMSDDQHLLRESWWGYQSSANRRSTGGINFLWSFLIASKLRALRMRMNSKNHERSNVWSEESQVFRTRQLSKSGISWRLRLWTSGINASRSKENLNQAGILDQIRFGLTINAKLACLVSMVILPGFLVCVVERYVDETHWELNLWRNWSCMWNLLQFWGISEGFRSRRR